jgi:hypothetical protein
MNSVHIHMALVQSVEQEEFRESRDSYHEVETVDVRTDRIAEAGAIAQGFDTEDSDEVASNWLRDLAEHFEKIACRTGSVKSGHSWESGHVSNGEGRLAVVAIDMAIVDLKQALAGLHKAQDFLPLEWCPAEADRTGTVHSSNHLAGSRFPLGTTVHSSLELESEVENRHWTLLAAFLDLVSCRLLNWPETHPLLSQ